MTPCIVNAGRFVAKEELIKAVSPHAVVTDESVTRCVSEHLMEGVTRSRHGREVKRYAARISQTSSTGIPIDLWEAPGWLMSELGQREVPAENLPCSNRMRRQHVVLRCVV